MNEPAVWRPGTTILLEEVWRGKLWSACPVTVVEDREDLLVLWRPRGTAWKTATTPPTRELARSRAERFARNLVRCDWILTGFTWDLSSLLLLRPDAWHAVWVSWWSDGRPCGWYVNFQRPFVRMPSGIQTMDLMLDIVIDQDQQWRWKDEDEFQLLLSRGILDTEEANRVRADAPEVINRIESNQPPFSEPWHDWRPDPSWPLPCLQRTQQGR